MTRSRAVSAGVPAASRGRTAGPLTPAPRTSPGEDPRRVPERGTRALPAPPADLVVRTRGPLAVRVSLDVGVEPEPASQWLPGHGPTLGVDDPARKGVRPGASGLPPPHRPEWAAHGHRPGQRQGHVQVTGPRCDQTEAVPARSLLSHSTADQPRSSTSSWMSAGLDHEDPTHCPLPLTRGSRRQHPEPDDPAAVGPAPAWPAALRPADHPLPAGRDRPGGRRHRDR